MSKEDIQQIINTAHYWQDRALKILDVLDNRLREAKDKEDTSKIILLEGIIEEIMNY